MELFSELFIQLDQTTKTNQKVEELVHYFDRAAPKDKIWAIALLSHKRPRRGVKTSLLREWAAEFAGIPLWLFEESYHVVGDLSETISLVLPKPAHRTNKPLHEWMNFIIGLKDKDDEEKKKLIIGAWDQLEQIERFVFNKLMGGGFRIGVSQKLMVKALSQHSGIEENVLAHRIMGDWTPDTHSFQQLILEENLHDDTAKPYPFYLAYPLEDEPATLGAIDEWQIERKWDGIRGQVICRKQQLFVWSRGEELMTDKFLEYEGFKYTLPSGTVLDGEIICFKDGKPLDFSLLQTRIGRKNISKSILEKAPVAFIAYDLMEFEGVDVREQAMRWRRERLVTTVEQSGHPNLVLSPLVDAKSWEEARLERARSREENSEGLMLKRKDSVYKVGRKRGDWWKWKVDPLSIDAVLIYAMRGHGRRANLYTDFTFAVRDGDTLVPFTKAYSGLTDQEFREVNTFIQRNTIDRFGPVRSVKPELVFEIHFEGIAKSTRHKSGVALRFPRMSRWRKDKPAVEANTKEDLLALLATYGS